MTSIEEDGVQKYYWDGGVISNTPLQVALELLGDVEPENKNIKWEVIVIELFSKEKSSLPQNIFEVNDRVEHLKYASKVDLAADFVSLYNAVIELYREAPEDAKERFKDGLRNMTGKGIVGRIEPNLKHLRKIDRFIRIEANLEVDELVAHDFSEVSINKRIAAGQKQYIKAVSQNSSTPTSA